MKIEEIKIENFKIFKNITIKSLPQMMVLVGPNGSGKSTFFDVFGFLNEALQNNLTTALQNRGGFAEVISRGCDPSKDLIKFEIKFRNAHSNNSKSPLITYSLDIGLDTATGKSFASREVVKYRRGARGKPWHFLDFKKGEGTAITNESALVTSGTEERTEAQKVSSPDILAIKGLGQLGKFETLSSFRELLEKWYVSDFKTDLARARSEAGVAIHLSKTGDNLAQVTQNMFDYHRKTFDQILEKLPQRIPGLSNVTPKKSDDGMIYLSFNNKHFTNPFNTKNVSDGTIKLFAYMILLHDPEPHPLLCIEEPENFLHPELLQGLCEEIRDYSDRGGQVFISTHSPDFLNGALVDEVFFLTKNEDGFSQINSAKNQELVRNLARDNQLGWLWRNGYIEGANLRDIKKKDDSK